MNKLDDHFQALEVDATVPKEVQILKNALVSEEAQASTGVLMVKDILALWHSIASG